MGMYFSVFSFCLILSVYFYILSRSDTFPDLGGMPCVRDILPSIRGPELYALGSLNIGCVGPPVLMRPTSVGMLAGGPGPGLVGYQVLPYVVVADLLMGQSGSEDPLS